jgi:SAM-dependent methyltransferase
MLSKRGNYVTLVRRIAYRLEKYRWRLRVAARPGSCPVCCSASRRRTGYGRRFLECRSCGFLWCHDTPEWFAERGMGMQGSWGGPEAGGERDDFLVRLLRREGLEGSVLIYGAGTTLVFRVLCEEGLDVFGADVSEEVVRFRSQEFPGRFLHAAELAETTLGFDVITACEVFEHLHDPRRWIGYLVQNLEPHGVLCGSTNLYPGHGPIEDGQPVGYMSLPGHVAYWSERSLATLMAEHGMDVVFFELVCPGSVKPDPRYNILFPNKRLYFASKDPEVVARLRARHHQEPILPLDTSDYPVVAYHRHSKPVSGASS